MPGWIRRVLAASALGAGATAVGYVGLVTGACPLDLGVGRRVRPLGPQLVDMAAPREVVFDVIAEPYLGRAPRALADKLRVLERGSDMVLAAHFTPLGGRLGLVAQTVETVRFSRPERVDFRLVRGPVPHVVEAFVLSEQAGGAGTRLAYSGEIGADLWRAGERWCAVVAARWEQTVAASLGAVKIEAERRAAASAASRRPGGRQRAGSWHEPRNQIRQTILEGAAVAPAYVFDVNETLLDLAALDPHFERAFGDPGAREAWFQQLIQSALVTIATGRYHQFGTIAKAALDTTATRHGVTLAEADKQAILQGMQELPPHPEVPAALGRLRDRGLRLAALTNSTGQVAQAQLANAGLAELFEQILSADQAGRLKPAPEPYLLAAERLGV
ncbi:MAG TPA: haloacid dehalogenase type II, partial [Actinomycetota bacterium]|nr:haloacid dehalogenase type II [Actinomycetota bacterium]